MAGATAGCQRAQIGELDTAVFAGVPVLFTSLIELVLALVGTQGMTRARAGRQCPDVAEGCAAVFAVEGCHDGVYQFSVLVITNVMKYSNMMDCKESECSCQSPAAGQNTANLWQTA